MATYSEFESSREDGRPIEFYRFRLGAVTWYYTTADHDQIIADVNYVAATIVAEAIKQTGEYADDALQIDVPSWIAPAQLFMTSPPTSPIEIEVFYKHVDSAELIIAYIGEIVQVNFPLPGRARLTCESLMSTMRREGLRLGWQRSCPYVLYDPSTCKVDRNAWKVDFIVLSINDLTIDVLLDTTQPPGHFDAGFLEWEHPVRGLEHLAIETHEELTEGESNARFLLYMPPGELFEGARGSAYPGCNFTPENCQAFNNYDNYGGHPDMPGKSPFDGDPVF